MSDESKTRKSSPKFRALSDTQLATYKQALAAFPDRDYLLDLLNASRISISAAAGLFGVRTVDMDSLFMGFNTKVTDVAIEYVTRCIEAATVLELLPTLAKDVEKMVKIGKAFVDLSDKYEALKKIVGE